MNLIAALQSMPAHKLALVFASAFVFCLTGLLFAISHDIEPLTLLFGFLFIALGFCLVVTLNSRPFRSAAKR